VVALCNRADHNIFMLFLSSSFFFFPRLISAVGDWMFTVLWLRQKLPSRHHAQLCRAISSQLRHVSTIGKKLLSSNISSTCSHNMVNFGQLEAEIVSGVWGTPATLNGFRVLAALLHGSQVMSVSQTLRR